MYDVAVIGAGVVGAMVARTLSKYNLKICILEKENDVAMGATKANSAIVHAGFDAKCGSLKAKLNVKGSEMMENVAKELGVKYKNNGSLVIGFNEEDRHTIFRTPTKAGKGILVSPTVDGNLLTGPTSVDIKDKEDKKTTQEGFESIIKEANENVDGIPYGKTITSFCGLRAAGSTGDFIINSPKERFINAAGIESPGLSASPAIAEMICEMLEEQGLILQNKEDYNPIRKPMHAFREASIEEKNKIIKENKAFGRIICRCETVTEGEILEAIRTNPKPSDLDGVKRRTRAQMGRCQGGFCSPYIIELLAKELNVSPQEITKCGGASKLITGKTKEVM